jgi:hypothetical protein
MDRAQSHETWAEPKVAPSSVTSGIHVASYPSGSHPVHGGPARGGLQAPGLKPFKTKCPCRDSHSRVKPCAETKPLERNSMAFGCQTTCLQARVEISEVLCG